MIYSVRIHCVPHCTVLYSTAVCIVCVCVCVCYKHCTVASWPLRAAHWPQPGSRRSQMEILFHNQNIISQPALWISFCNQLSEYSQLSDVLAALGWMQILKFCKYSIAAQWPNSQILDDTVTEEEQKRQIYHCRSAYLAKVDFSKI